MTPRPKSEEKKHKIIQAAIKNFSMKGLEKATISSIAREAGIGKGTVYQYFASKEEIFSQIIYVFFEEMFANWNQLIASNISPHKKVAIMLEQTIDISLEMINSDDTNYFNLLMEIFIYSLRNKDKVNLDVVLADLYKIIEPVIEEGIREGIFRQTDAKYAGFILFSFLDGFALHLFFQHKNYDPEKLKTLLKEIVLKGILK